MQTCAQAQETPAQENTVGKQYLKDVLHDEKIIWTSPARIRSSHLPWLIPFFATTGGLIATDSNVAKQLPGSPSLISNSRTLANAGLALAVGGGASYYLWGRFAHNDHAREAGVLSSEAAIHSAIVAEVLKLMAQRERPSADVRGRFFQGGSSFPSEHAMLSWSIASVFAHEYPHTIIPFLSYSAASGVSLARVLGRDHFPSDIFVGSVLGYAIGRYVYNTHHDQELPGANIGAFTPSGPDYRREGTTWVALDSWVYPAIDRLAALGYANGISGLRPWTRIECARMVEEAGQTIEGEGAGPGMVALYQRLVREFAPEIEGTISNSEGRIEDLYARAGFISGQPLADDYHFAKTMVDDFGRPFGEGANLVSGVSSRVIAGSFGLYVRGEYEYAGALPPYSAPVLQDIANVDSTLFAVQQRTNSLNRFQFLDSYVSLNYRNNIISFGKQTLWWGPGAEAPFLFSDNVEPLPLLRISRATPFVLPWIFHYLGGIRVEFIWGQLNGTHFVSTHSSFTQETDFTPPIRPHPYIHGEKVSFKPTRNFEFGFGVTSLFGGPGFPLTIHNFLKSYSLSNTAPGFPGDPGDRRSGFDFSYRLPYVRDWLTFYADSFTEDEFSPIIFPRKSSMRGGFYMPKLPKLNRLDLRAEGLYTDIPSLGVPGVEYFNGRFRSGYTNWGQLIGSWVGREGNGISAYSTYHFSERNDFTLHYRNQKVNPEFLSGGHLQDFAASGTFAKTNGLTFKGALQYEHWAFPLLSAIPKENVIGSLEIRFQPSQGWKLW
ncbi:MAG: hypothetical protein DMG65_15205 [Candidatus Angelobacter sp. Gp1-AA117]|nr:MAG: hypothetical protein DMG65_15205 [Candidatus Angelobacter sp. Gp1-AA117]